MEKARICAWHEEGGSFQMPWVKPWAARRGCGMMYGAPQGAGCLPGTNRGEDDNMDREGATLAGETAKKRPHELSGRERA